MRFTQFYLVTFFVIAFTAGCAQKNLQTFPADNAHIRYSGRVDFTNPGKPVLIGSASFAEISFTGDSCLVLLKKLNPAGEHNFVSLEADGEDMGRIKLETDSMAAYPILLPAIAETHIVKILKATEAQTGNVIFGGVKCKKLVPLPPKPERKIEFIGNSITCGMGIDWEEIPCNSGVWYDQHNAYRAYGPLVAKELNAQFMLSSVSGIGIYRNWNSLSPVMPDVYENMYLNTDSTRKWDFSTYTPDLVSICLGTNDFSDGDGLSERLPFDSAKYVSEYIRFVGTIYSHYPETQLCLLTSPMLSGEKSALLGRCLETVKQHFSVADPDKKEIAICYFSTAAPHGCSYHPDRNDHLEMAGLLVPFYKKVMGW